MFILIRKSDMALGYGEYYILIVELLAKSVVFMMGKCIDVLSNGKQ